MKSAKWALAASIAMAVAQPGWAQTPGTRHVVAGEPPQPMARVAQLTIIHAGKLLATPGQSVRQKATVVVNAAGKVEAVRDGYLDAAALGLPAATPIVDLSSKFVMPGFMDLHVHITSSGIGGRVKNAKLREEDAFFALNGYTNALTTLMAGFTTIRDLGAANGAIFPLRDAINAGVVPGPHILAAGAGITPTNGHADAHDLKRSLLDAETSDNSCNGADDCMRATRAAIKYGADVIKVHVTGGVLDPSDGGTEQQFTDEELKAILWAGHSMGRKVTTHAHGKHGIDAAVRAGYDSIEHAMWADEESLKLMKAHGTWLIPTVWPISWVGDTPEMVMKGPFKDLPPNSLAKMLKLGDQPKKMVRMAIRIGVPIALGTDAGIAPHGTNAQEMLEYVDAGMSKMEALKTGTVNAAQAAGIPDRGSLSTGMVADIIALDDDPLVDMEAVMKVNFVMRDGIIFKRDGARVDQ